MCHSGKAQRGKDQWLPVVKRQVGNMNMFNEVNLHGAVMATPLEVPLCRGSSSPPSLCLSDASCPKSKQFAIPK